MELQTASGDIILQNVEGEVTVITSSGNIKMNNEVISGDLSTEASSGDVHVSYGETPTSVSIEFQGSSGEGKVNIDDIEYEEKTEEDIIGKIGKGEYKIKVKTSSGEFVLD